MMLGSERLLASSRLDGLKVGILANPASIDHDFIHVVDRLGASSRFKLAAIFGPQHGFRSDLQDNMIETPARQGSAPQRADLLALQRDARADPGDARSDRCARHRHPGRGRAHLHLHLHHGELPAAPPRAHGVPVIVCDRPNPIGGIDVEGPTLEPGYELFVGLFRMPMRHGMTVAELAHLFNEHFKIGAELETVPMEGWSRDMYFDATDVPWVMPSPNMPTLDTAIVYPGTVLFEGTMLSEGRGTTRPFELIGAPWLDGEALAARLNRIGLKGVHFRAATFEPTFQKHAKTTCGGCQIHRDLARRLRAGRGRRVGACARATASRPTASNGAIRLTNTSTTRCRSTFSQARQSSASRSRSRCRSMRSSRAGRQARRSSPRSERPICSTEHAKALAGQIAQRQHRAAERLLQRLDQILLRFGADIEAAIFLGETFGIEDALLARPAQSLHADSR